MEPNKSEHLCTVRFDEELETWFVHTGSGRIPLSRVLLQHLVTLYNDIHRGSALTLVDRRAFERLDLERRELADEVPSLADHIAADHARRRASCTGLRRALARGIDLILRLARPRPR